MREQIVYTRGELTENEKRYLSKLLKMAEVTRRVGLSEVEKLIVSVLLLDERPITTSSLSELTLYSRKTVLGVLRDLERMDCACQDEEGWIFTDRGRDLFLRMFREGLLIGKGDLEGYSRELKDDMRSLPTKGVSRPFVGLD